MESVTMRFEPADERAAISDVVRPIVDMNRNAV